MLDIPINALTLFAVVIARPQQFGPSWMTIAVSLVCLFAVVIAIRGDGCGDAPGRLRQRYRD
jgi:hypothetical protein